MGNRQPGGVDPRSARSVGAKGAPSKFFFVLSDDSHRSARLREQDLPPRFDPRPLLHPLFASILAPGGRALVPSISTQRGGTTPPPPLFDTTGRSAPPCCAFFPFFDATRCGPRLYVIFSSQWGGVHLLSAFSSLFHTHAKHERTPSLVSFCVRRLFFYAEHKKTLSLGVWSFPAPFEHDQIPTVGVLFMPCAFPHPSSTNAHLRGCVFVLDALLHHLSITRRLLWVSVRALHLHSSTRDGCTARGACSLTIPENARCWGFFLSYCICCIR
jgi:hypothetical protein